MKLFTKIEGDTAGEQMANLSVERAGAVLTAAPALCILYVLAFGMHWLVLLALAYAVTFAAAEGTAALVYLGLKKLETAGIRRRAMSVPAAA